MSVYVALHLTIKDGQAAALKEAMKKVMRGWLGNVLNTEFYSLAEFNVKANQNGSLKYENSCFADFFKFKIRKGLKFDGNPHFAFTL